MAVVFATGPGGRPYRGGEQQRPGEGGGLIGHQRPLGPGAWGKQGGFPPLHFREELPQFLHTPLGDEVQGMAAVAVARQVAAHHLPAQGDGPAGQQPDSLIPLAAAEAVDGDEPPGTVPQKMAGMPATSTWDSTIAFTGAPGG